MAADVESDTLAIIEAGTALTEGTDLFRGPVVPAAAIGETHPVPQTACFVRFSAGSQPLVHRQEGLEEKEWMVDIVVRGEPMGYNTTRALAQTVLDAVNDNPASGYIDAKTMTSHPQWVDRDDHGADYFLVTLRLRKLEA